MRVAPADEGLEGADLVGSQIDDRLVVELELAGSQRPAQIDLHDAPLLHLRIHFRLEEAESAAAILLCPVESEVGVAHERVGVLAVAGADGDADAGADDHLLPVDLVGAADGFDHATRKRSGVGRLGDVSLQNGKLVATHARDDVGVARERAQPFRDHLEEFVAGGVAEGVVDVLEVVEIEEVCRYLFTAFGPGKRLFELLIEQDAVGQAGERVVMRHVGDLGLGAALLGDVLMRRDRSAVGHRPHRDGEAAAVAELAVEDGRRSSSRRRSMPLTMSSADISDFRPLAMRCSIICFSVVPGCTCAGVSW